MQPCEEVQQGEPMAPSLFALLLRYMCSHTIGQNCVFSTLTMEHLVGAQLANNLK